MCCKISTNFLYKQEFRHKIVVRLPTITVFIIIRIELKIAFVPLRTVHNECSWRNKRYFINQSADALYHLLRYSSTALRLSAFFHFTFFSLANWVKSALRLSPTYFSTSLLLASMHCPPMAK